MKKANILLDDNSTGLAIIEKMDWEYVNEVFDTLHFVFHPEKSDHNETDDRFIGLWKIFLASVGWTEDEFWMEWEDREDGCGQCDDCKKKAEEELAAKDTEDKLKVN